MKALAGRWLTLLFLLLAGTMLWSAGDLSRVSGWIPRIVLAVTCSLLLCQAALDLWRARRAAGRPLTDEEAVRRGCERHAVAWIGCFLLLTWVLGVLAGSVLFCLAWMRWHAGERWLHAALLAAAVGLVLRLVFGGLLGATLYPGLLAGLLA